ncbi:MAG: MFS transporter [Lachnospiraceae bacterium]|nr:MFS transporter [Lachnospiraceae bacterium]
MLKLNIRTQIKKIYGFELSVCFRITDAVWVLFLLQRGFSLVQIGVAEGIFHVTSMVCEVPSGMLADLIGRKRMLMVSGLLGVLSALFMGMDGGLTAVCLGMIFSALSYNAMSGTEEAILYDSLLSGGEEGRFGSAWAVISVIGRCGAAAACLASPAAVALGYRGTYLLGGLLSMLGFLFAASLKEPQVTSAQKARQEQPFRQLGSRFAAHVKSCGIFMREHPLTMCKLLADAAIACPTYLLIMFSQEHLTASGWPAAWIGLPLLFMRLCGAAGSWAASRSWGRRTRRTGWSLSRLMMVCGLLGGMGTLLAGSRSIGLIFLGAGLAQACEGFSAIKVSENTNRDFESDQRATMVSVDSMLYSVLMIAASPVVGRISDGKGVPAGFAALGIGLIAGTLAAGGIYRAAVRRRRSVSV